MKEGLKIKSEPRKVVLAWILALALALGIFPVSSRGAAENTTDTGSIIILVKDGGNQAVCGAAVVYTYTTELSDSSGETDIETTSGNGITDENGKVTISGFDFTEGSGKRYTLTGGTVTKDGYEEGVISETTLAMENQEVSVQIMEKVTQETETISFVNTSYAAGGVTLEFLTGKVPYESGNTYDFAAKAGDGTGTAEVTYSLTEGANLAEVDANGALTVKYPGKITVKAEINDGNFQAASVSHTLEVKGTTSRTGDYLSFDAASKEYTLGTSNGVVSEQSVRLCDENVEGTITYGANLDERALSEAGLSLDSATGKLTVGDFGKLAAAIQGTDGTGAELSVTITATKAASDDYGADSASYSVMIKFAEAPASPYRLTGTKAAGNGWYQTNVTVTPVSGYEIAQSVSDVFGGSTVLSGDGGMERYVYLKETSTGAITNKIAVRENNEIVRIDTVAPGEINIEYTQPVASSLIGQIIYQFYNPDVTVTFWAKDDGSGVASFAWTYENPAGAGLYTGEEDTAGTLTATQHSAGTYTASVTLPLKNAIQLCGSISVKVTDNAGNVSEQKSDGTVVVVDTVAPMVDADFGNPDGTNGIASYYNKDVTAVFRVTETNFFAEDVTLLVSKDGGAYEAVIPTWSDKTATYRLEAKANHANDGAYIFRMQYTDRSGNQLEYTSGTIVIDTVSPEVGVAYTNTVPVTTRTDRQGNTRDYFSNTRTATVTITEHNFNPRNVNFTILAQDVNGKELGTGANVTGNALEKEEYEYCSFHWAEDGDVHTVTITYPGDANYTFDVDYRDLAANAAVYGTDKDTDYAPDYFTVDKTAPALESSYTTPDRTVGSTSYYNKDVTVTFKMTELNFFTDEVKVQVSKDGGTFTDVAVSWTAAKKMNVYYGTYTISAADHSGDGNYQLRVAFADRSENKMTEYTSDMIVMDTTAPVIGVSYANTSPVNILTNSENHTRSYFDCMQTATVTITEHNFNAGDVNFKILAQDANGKELGTGANVTGNALAFDKNGNALENAEYKYCSFRWADNGDVHTVTITYPGDANYTFDVDYVDLAANAAADYAADFFTVDTTAPESLSVSYSNSVMDTMLSSIAFGFYNAQMTVTITARDTISPVRSFRYAYRLAPGVGNVNSGLDNQVIDWKAIRYSDGCATATASFTIPRSVPGNGNQFNGTVDFTAMDCANNESASLTDTKRIVVDNIAPTATVEYNAPVSETDGISYYDETVTAAVTVTEANFYAEDVQITATKDGASYPVNTTWSDTVANVHVGTFRLSDDGDYFVTIHYSDKSGNRMATYTSGQLTVDTQITPPVITINGEEGNGKAFQDEVVLAVSFQDVNYESYKISLACTRCYEIGADVTEKFIQPGVQVNAEGGNGIFDTFEKTADADGIYTMKVMFGDKAGHTAEEVCTFTVNRYGSVYVYGDALIDLIQDGGKYVKNVDEDLTITEYNADRLAEGSLDIAVSCNGHAVDDVDYRVSPQLNDKATTGESGWYQYEYTISKENFAKEGVYKVAVASEDHTGNLPETTNYEDKNILFRVDKNAPEINSITGLEDSIVNAADVEVNYSVYDSMGLASVEVYVVDAGEDIDWDAAEPVQAIAEFDNLNNYEGSFYIKEKSAKEEAQAQSVRLVVTDLSGRVTDTADTDGENAFAPAFDFHDTVTISTNFFVRWFANKPLFIGSIAAAAAATAGMIVIVAFKRRKRNESMAGKQQEG